MSSYSKINDVDMGVPFRIGEDGSITVVYPQVYGPEVHHDEADHIRIDAPEGEDWEAFSTGYTGQWMSAGSPVMHASEYIGGRLETDMLESPGVYVVETVEVLPDDEDEDPEPAGWVVLKLNSDKEAGA